MLASPPNRPKNRLGIISPGIGRLASALVILILGVIALFFNRQYGLTLISMALMFGAWGGVILYRGLNARQKSITCPHCGQRNDVLAEIREFNCFSCNKPIKLVRKK